MEKIIGQRHETILVTIWIYTLSLICVFHACDAKRFMKRSEDLRYPLRCHGGAAGRAPSIVVMLHGLFANGDKALRPSVLCERLMRGLELRAATQQADRS